jgi:YD repeat-containing protein
MVNFFGDASSVYSITYAYDLAGRLITMSSANGDTPASETSYTYDDKGRLLGITSGPGESSVFSYDNRGIRTRITKSKISAALASSGSAYSFPVPEEEDPFLPVPAGGQIKTVFNEDDRPVEWQVLDANGNVTNRLIRSYDEQGRVSESSFIMENLATNLPIDLQEKLMAEPGAAEELAKETTRLLGSKQEFMRMTYQYDAEGRPVERRMYVGSTFMQMVTKTTYNDHSDKIEERTTTFGDPNPQSGGPDAPAAIASETPSQDTLVRYSYNYDTFGNWTQQTMSTQSAPGAPFVESAVTRRTVSYY